MLWSHRRAQNKVRSLGEIFGLKALLVSDHDLLNALLQLQCRGCGSTTCSWQPARLAVCSNFHCWITWRHKTHSTTSRQFHLPHPSSSHPWEIEWRYRFQYLFSPEAVELFCHIWLELRTNWTAWWEWNRDKKCIGWKFHISKSIHMISCRLTQECQSISIWFAINLGVSASVRIAPRIWVEILTSAIWWPRYQNQDYIYSLTWVGYISSPTREFYFRTLSNYNLS